MNAWLPIESAPKEGSRILAWNENWSSPNTVQFYGVRGWGIDYDGIFKSQPTHWMPLPEPPSNYKNNEIISDFDRQFENLTDEEKWDKAKKAIDNMESRFNDN